MKVARDALHHAAGAGVMFHHFHGASFPVGQGSISAQQLADLIEYVGLARFLDPDEWSVRARAGRLGAGDLCLTFDDGLACQAAVAVPVLESLGLRAFWFVCSAPLQGVVQRLEIYRYFRDVFFGHVEDFYRTFVERLKKEPFWPEVREALSDFSPARYLLEFPFYSDGDRRFRYLRDRVLGPARYFAVMDGMLAETGTDPVSLSQRLFINDAMVRRLSLGGHRVGLHSHSHPTNLGALPEPEQRREFQTNRDHLEKVTGHPVRAMAHPCNDYNASTLAIFEDLGIDVGFRSNMSVVTNPGRYEYPREDHINLIREMGQ